MTEQLTEHDLHFRIWNCYWLETMTATFNRRIDTVINAVLLTLGAAVFTQSHLSWLFGGVIAVLSGCRMAWQFGHKAESAQSQAKRYSALMNCMAGLSADELLARLSLIEDTDSPVMGCLIKPAWQKACIAMGMRREGRLNVLERLAAALAGGIQD